MCPNHGNGDEHDEPQILGTKQRAKRKTERSKQHRGSSIKTELVQSIEFRIGFRNSQEKRRKNKRKPESWSKSKEHHVVFFTS